ncbi:unnamed protein product [Zymoseptoria tritici ST99CH_1A5]|uniref:MYND-type domain-containing protein n=1 Tax=Zymoseptoria tritici ST99CH_1A5 TaxID=1276529 RepID=A0A1Y6LYG8_ZYMTR|nr:unnamed protein product [Zymoseptoria tritici ST99CH_1A5]
MAEKVRCLLPQQPPNTTTPAKIKQKFTGQILITRVVREKLAHYGHRPSSVAAQLGVPLNLATFPVSDAADLLSMGFTGFDFVAQVLLIDSNPESPNFGDVPSDLVSGPFLVTHSDGLDLESDAILAVMIDYIDDHFTAYRERVLTIGEDHEEEKKLAKQHITQKLSKEAFHAYFEERRRLAIAEGRPFRKGKSPVLLTHSNVSPACGTCGALVSSASIPAPVKLSMCAKCKSRYYCSKECQVKDWSTHKKACKIKIMV